MSISRRGSHPPVCDHAASGVAPEVFVRRGRPSGVGTTWLELWFMSHFSPHHEHRHSLRLQIVSVW
ncbi:unnamed protein product [Prunus armeniaca]|uniref:Uncharacterized protein n=1 Tax=Prunus armeniaca TaxID=36596 RepID=A0A6J5VNJ4_PRUAR|nr:unnamed protein product [Prunus armeniaca]